MLVYYYAMRILGFIECCHSLNVLIMEGTGCVFFPASFSRRGLGCGLSSRLTVWDAGSWVAFFTFVRISEAVLAISCARGILLAFDPHWCKLMMMVVCFVTTRSLLPFVSWSAMIANNYFSRSWRRVRGDLFLLPRPCNESRGCQIPIDKSFDNGWGLRCLFISSSSCSPCRDLFHLVHVAHVAHSFEEGEAWVTNLCKFAPGYISKFFSLGSF